MIDLKEFTIYILIGIFVLIMLSLILLSQGNDDLSTFFYFILIVLIAIIGIYAFIEYRSKIK